MNTQVQSLRYRDAQLVDLPLIVSIYNSTVKGRMVTADTEAVTVESRLPWFSQHNPLTRPLWIVESAEDEIIGWVSFQSFYGRPAYDGTVEISIYIDEKQRKKGYGKTILQEAVNRAPDLQVSTILAFIFAHNTPSIRLFEKAGFLEWGNFPDIAVLDGIQRSLIILGRKVGES
ncbi:N-acetyltransferase family protein [Olivibacter sp. CPCC 100613]|uniref:GNAT family N-acetyltransferase n=1 Tax=Olivibacter sp. CPCC 100613 TaxID=3079931 RepID=UPI002FFC056E